MQVSGIVDPLAIVWSTAIAAAVLTASSMLMERQGQPIAALSWPLAIFAVPPIAVVSWWLFGRTHLRRKRRLRREASEEIAATLW